MNGVRRFLGGGGLTLARSPSPSDPPATSNMITPFNDTLSASSQSSSPSGSTPIPEPLPPASRPTSDSSNFTNSNENGPPSSSVMSPKSPGTTTKAQFFRASKSRQNTLQWDSDGQRSSSISSSRSRSPSNSFPNGTGRRSDETSSNAGLSRPPLPSLAKAVKASEPNPRASPSTSVPLTSASLTWRNANPMLNIKDELLMSLLASQAVVDSRDSEILSADEVEELKRGYSLVASRASSASRKLSTETRIRDAALKLHNLDRSKGVASPSSLSDGASDQLAAANRKVEAAHQELYRLSERANELSRRLLEHRAGVLSFSVWSLEKRVVTAAGAPGMVDTDSESSAGLSGEMSPASTTATSSSVAPHRKFDGAHFFAGHADAINPAFASPARTKELEEKLKQADDASEHMRRRFAEMERELEVFALEKSRVQTSMGIELQTAEDRIADLQSELKDAGEMADRIEDLEDARQAWEHDRRELQDQLLVAQSSQGRNAEAEEAVVQLREELLSKASENQSLLEERRNWEAEKGSLQRSLTEYRAGATEELLVAREALRSMCRHNRLDMPPNDAKLSTYITVLEEYLSASDDQKEQLNEDRERLNNELDEARRQREEARQETRAVEAKFMKERSDTISSLPPSRTISAASRRGSDDSVEGDRVASLLKPLWAVLPSVEARSSRLGTGRRQVPPQSPKGGKFPESPPLSLSELDVRSLKALYDSKGSYNSPSVSGAFSLEDFASRVHALIQDDRALVERLIRFAQAHDLLKTNAERAQKLAQDSSMGLETYSKQVKTMEERNQTLLAKQAELLDEIDDLQIALEKLEEQKHALEEQATEQAETVKQLNEANNTLSAKTLALASEAMGNPEHVKKLEQKIKELKDQLHRVEDELDRTRAAESMQRVALLDELNSLQQENGTLRNQLRQRQGTK